MSEWFIQAVNYIGDKTWYYYTYWASMFIEDKRLHYLADLKKDFLKDVCFTLFSSALLALVLTTIYIIIYRNRQGIKVSKTNITQVASIITFINFFKWEFILLFPLLLIAWCITYIKLQENKKIIEKVKSWSFVVFLTFTIYFILSSSWLLI